MLNGRRNVSITICVTALVFASGVLGATRRKPHATVPPVADISSIQVVFNSTSPNPKPNLSDSSQGAKLLRWIKSAKPMGYEQSSPFMMSMGPTEVLIKLDNHKEIEISEAWLPTTITQPDGRVLQALKRSNEYVDIQSSDTIKMTRYYSPELATWLNSGWQRDRQQ